MRAKNYFYEIYKLEQKIESKILIAQTYRNLATSTSSPVLDDMPKNPNRNISKMADALAKALIIENEIIELKEELRLKNIEAIRVIESIKVMEYQNILLKRYFEKKDWNQIIEEMHYSRSGIFKLHSKALESFKNNFKRVDLSRLE